MALMIKGYHERISGSCDIAITQATSNGGNAQTENNVPTTTTLSLSVTIARRNPVKLHQIG